MTIQNESLNICTLTQKSKQLGALLSPKFFKALCDPNRLFLLNHLVNCKKARTVSEIADLCTVDLSVVSRHLKALKEAGIIESERKGKQVFYRVRARQVVASLRAIADVIEASCGKDEDD